MEEADDDGLVRQAVMLSPHSNPQHAAAAARCPCAYLRRGAGGCSARSYGSRCKTASLVIKLIR